MNIVPHQCLSPLVLFAGSRSFPHHFDAQLLRSDELVWEIGMLLCGAELGDCRIPCSFCIARIFYPVGGKLLRPLSLLGGGSARLVPRVFPFWTDSSVNRMGHISNPWFP